MAQHCGGHHMPMTLRPHLPSHSNGLSGVGQKTWRQGIHGIHGQISGCTKRGQTSGQHSFRLSFSLGLFGFSVFWKVIYVLKFDQQFHRPFQRAWRLWLPTSCDRLPPAQQTPNNWSVSLGGSLRPSWGWAAQNFSTAAKTHHSPVSKNLWWFFWSQI